MRTIIDLIPQGHVAIPKPGAACAGFVTHHGGKPCARDPKWFGDCAGHLKPRYVRRWIGRHHEVVTTEGCWKRAGETIPPFGRKA